MRREHGVEKKRVNHILVAVLLRKKRCRLPEFCNFSLGKEMVRQLNFPNVCEEDPLGMSCRADRGLDSPDSGLPPSPSPSAWLLPQDKARGVSPVPEDERNGSRVGNRLDVSPLLTVSVSVTFSSLINPMLI